MEIDMSQAELRKNPEQPVFDANQRYACRDCPARCCRAPWNIFVKREEYERYRATPWIEERLAADGVDFQPHQDGFNLPRTQKADGGFGCAFLDDDNLCAIQKREGHQAIPLTCQVYPFQFMETAETPYTVPSFYCRSILHNYGEPLAEVVPDKYRHWHENRGRLTRMPETVSLAGTPMDQRTYFLLCDKLAALFTDDETTTVKALLTGRTVVNTLGQTCLDAPEVTMDDIEAAFGNPVEYRAPEVEHQQGGGSLAIRVLVAVSIIALFVKSGDCRPVGRTQFIRTLVNLMRYQGQVRLWDLPDPVSLEALQGIALNEAERPLMEKHIRRYIAGILASKLFLCQKSDDILKAYFHLGISYAAIFSVARMMAVRSGRRQVAAEDVLEAIGYIDVGIRFRLESLNVPVGQALIDNIVALLSTSDNLFEQLALSS